MTIRTPERGGHVIKDEGVAVAQRETLDFTGAGVTVTDETGRTKVDIPGGGGSGVVGVAQLHAVRITKSAAQTLTTGILTALTFDQEDYDVGGLHDNVTNNTRITFQRSGKYKITGHVVFASNATGLRAVRIRKNGATNIALTEVAAASGESMGLPVTTELDVIAGDYVELIGYQTSGGNLNVQTVETAFMAFEIALAAPWKTRNLVIENDATTPASKIKVTADEITIEDVLASTVSVTADIATAGANGLDTGTEAASTWYAVWVIYNPSTSTVASLLSASFTAPTMPSGYTKKRRVGAVRNDNSSNFIKFQQMGDIVDYTDVVYDSNHHRMLSAGTATAFTTVACAVIVPPSSKRAFARMNRDGADTTGYTKFRITGSGAAEGTPNLGGAANVAIWLFISLNSSQQFDYMHSAVNRSLYIDILGYFDPVL